MTVARRRLVLAAAIAGAASTVVPVKADNFPSGHVRIIVPQAAGSGTDVIGRLMSERLAKGFGVPFIVENRPGANGLSGTAEAAQAKPDGHTLLLVAASVMTLNPHLFVKLDYDPEKSFAPVAFIGETTVAIAVAEQSPYRTLQELVSATARAKEGTHYSIPAVASMPHLMGELLAARGARLIAVPYRGGGAATLGIMGGEVSVMIDSITTLVPLVRDGRVRVLAVGSSRRMPTFAEVPTLGEIYPGAEASGWFAVFAPAGTPQDRVALLSERIVGLLKQPDLRERLAQLGVFPVVDNTPKALATRLQRDSEQYGEIIRARKIRIG